MDTALESQFWVLLMRLLSLHSQVWTSTVPCKSPASSQSEFCKKWFSFSARPGPRSELEFWRGRMQKITSITDRPSIFFSLVAGFCSHEKRLRKEQLKGADLGARDC